MSNEIFKGVAIGFHKLMTFHVEINNAVSNNF